MADACGRNVGRHRPPALRTSIVHTTLLAAASCGAAPRAIVVESGAVEWVEAESQPTGEALLPSR